MRLLGVYMGRMHETPALVDRRVIKQPIDRATTAPCDAIVPLLELLGNVQRQRSGWRHGHKRRKLRWRHGAQAVWRDADARTVKRGDSALTRVAKLRKLLKVVDKAALPLTGHGITEVA